MTCLTDIRKIFAGALQAHSAKFANADFVEDDLTAPGFFDPGVWNFDESGHDIAADLIEIQPQIRKARRKIARRKWRQTEAGQTARKRERKVWRKTETGKASSKATNRKASLDHYLNRRIVAIDSEGRCPLHMIDSMGRTPLEAYKATGCLKYLTRDSSGHYWESHELSLIGAAEITRPYGAPIEQGTWEEPVWIELTPKRQSEQVFEYLLSLTNSFPNEHRSPPLYVMFMASYDWSMWLQDIDFGRAFEIARQRSFDPPCKRMRGMVFWRKYAIKVRPFYDFKLSELRWPDDPYGKDHTNDPAYQKPGKNKKSKLQVLRRITITDTFRFAPKPFVEAIRPMVKRGLIPKEVFDTIEQEKKKRGGFHLEPMENIKKYCGYELHSLCCFMHMIRDACWTSAELRLKSFHSPAAIASVLLERIDVRSHSWPVKSVNLDYEQEIAHWSYFGGRFEWIYKGYNKCHGYQIDLANAYPYGMQFLPSMKGGHWEKWDPKNQEDKRRLAKLTRKTVEQSCILSIFRVRFCFYADAPFYPLPLRMLVGNIRFPRIGYGYYIRDDVLSAMDWCKKFKIPVERAVIVEEANFFHPAFNAVTVPFAMLEDIYRKRIEFDKKDPKGPEQEVLKTGMCSCYGKLAERRYRGDDPETGEPMIPPYVCPWYASAITAHTRRELMKVALIAPELVIGFATDAIYLESLVRGIPRLKAEADIKAGKEDKLLGDWCWTKIPAAVFVQSGLAFYLNDTGKVVEVKCRGLPVKSLEKAQVVVEDIIEAWKEPYDPESVRDLKPKKGKTIARHVTVKLRAFMPLTSAITSLDKFNKLFCKWGDVTKTIWLDDAGRKRDIDEEDLNLLLTEAVQTRPKENPDPEKLSALRFPDWVENKHREEKRQEAAVNQYYNIEEAEFNERFGDDEGEEYEYDDDTRELNELLEMNENIEV